ncbi:OmpA family protein [Sulfurimonas sp.]|uniref:OmpA family protein n=1 Tax=Sulfurimonas sp. TaxID=2022749 RepID=UPI003D0F4B4F
MYLKQLIFLTFVALTLDAQIYLAKDTTPLQENNTTKDQFFYGNYKEIIRFEPLAFDGDGNLTQKAEDDFKKIVDTIKEKDQKGEGYLLTVVGHYDKPTDDYYEEISKSSAYGRDIYGLFEDEISSKTSYDLSKKHALAIKDKLVDEKVDEKLITTEYRAGQDSAYSNDTENSRSLSNRVMVSMYVNHIADMDSDQDGVLNKRDKCPNTPPNTKVDLNGCSLDSDKDGVVDYVDQCPDTLKGVLVDAKGCPLDDDQDGVANYKDKCPGTKLGLEVDINGCPYKETLGLNFERGSDKILRDSYAKVVKFATFMKRNPLYNVTIIGHTDSRGSTAKNLKLSQDRANTTKGALVKEGVEEARIKTVGKGEIEPIATNRTKEGRRQNRRIEVELSVNSGE